MLDMHAAVRNREILLVERNAGRAWSELDHMVRAAANPAVPAKYRPVRGAEKTVLRRMGFDVVPVGVVVKHAGLHVGTSAMGAGSIIGKFFSDFERVPLSDDEIEECAKAAGVHNGENWPGMVLRMRSFVRNLFSAHFERAEPALYWNASERREAAPGETGKITKLYANPTTKLEEAK